MGDVFSHLIFSCCVLTAFTVDNFMISKSFVLQTYSRTQQTFFLDTDLSPANNMMLQQGEILTAIPFTIFLTDVVNGQWSQWGPWGTCSETEVCNRGSKVRTRQCNSPAPQNGGQLCAGPGSESEECPKTNCKGRKSIKKYLQ